MLRSLIIALAFSSLVNAQTGTQDLSGRNNDTGEILRQLIESHPSPAVSDTLHGWIVDGIVWLSYESDDMPPEMFTELVDVQGRLTPTLVINPAFLRGRLRSSLSAEEDELYKQLVLFHEYTHLENHFSGKVSLLPAYFTEEKIPDRSRHLWQAEYNATYAEWQIAKELKAEHLLPEINRQTSLLGEEAGFLEGFQKMLVRGAFVSHPEDCLPYWQEMYLKEKAKLSK